MMENQSAVGTKMSSTAVSSPAEPTKTDRELDTTALELGWNNRENVWSATARFLRAFSAFSKSLWAWLNHPVIALLSGIIGSVVIVCIAIGPRNWYSAAIVAIYVAGFQIVWQLFLGRVRGTQPRPPYLQMIRYTRSNSDG